VTKDDKSDSDASDHTQLTLHTDVQGKQASVIDQSKLQTNTRQSNQDVSHVLNNSKQASVSKAEFTVEESSVAPSLHGELNSDNIYMNSDFWYHKGVVLN